jgi:hypothetical protein
MQAVAAVEAITPAVLEAQAGKEVVATQEVIAVLLQDLPVLQIPVVEVVLARMAATVHLLAGQVHQELLSFVIYQVLNAEQAVLLLLAAAIIITHLLHRAHT